MPEIAFSSHGISFQLKKIEKTKEWLGEIARKEGRKIDALTYVFVSDVFLAKLNEQFLGHNAFTDILTFDYSENKSIVGEVFISIPRVRENAKTYQQSFEKELRRVIAHGLLHLLGYQDKTARQSAQMRRKEEACLSLWS